MLWTILIVILILALLGGVGGPYVGAPWPHGYGAGVYGTGGLGLVLLIVIIIVALRGGILTPMEPTDLARLLIIIAVAIAAGAAMLPEGSE